MQCYICVQVHLHPNGTAYIVRETLKPMPISSIKLKSAGMQDAATRSSQDGDGSID